MPPRRSRRAHTRAATSASRGLAAPVAPPAPTGAMSLSSGFLSSSGTIPSTAGVRRGRGGCGAVVAPLAPQIEPTLRPVDDFVPSCDGVLALIQDELQTLQSQLIPKSPSPLLVPSVAGGPQSGELPF